MQGPHEPPSVATVFASGNLSHTRVRVPRMLSTAAKVLYASQALTLLAYVFGTDIIAFAPSLVASLAWPLFLASFIASLHQTSFAGSIEVTSTHLALHAGRGAPEVIPLSQITGALVVERESFGALVPSVEIERIGGDRLTIYLRDPAQANAVVRALGFGRGGRRVRADLMKPAARLLHPALAVAAYMLAMMMTMLPMSLLPPSWAIGTLFGLHAPVALGLYAIFRRLAQAPVVTVGDDGVLVERGFSKRMILRREIASITWAPGMIMRILTTGGSTVLVKGPSIDDYRRAAVVRAIDERSGVSTAQATVVEHYERRGRPVREWREQLAHAMGDAGYRATARAADEAAAVLDSPIASPEARVGAALALRIAGAPPARIRVAAEASADENVRVALEAVAAEAESEANDAVLEKAVMRLPR